MPKKSKCDHERRNSPSVASCNPTSSCWRMRLRISRSSTSLSCASLISFFSCLARASWTACGRRKLPTWSARNGGLVLFIGSIPRLNGGGCRRSGRNLAGRNEAQDRQCRQPQNAAAAPAKAGGKRPIAVRYRASMPLGAAPGPLGGGHAEILLEDGAVGLERRAVGLVHNHAALENDRAVGDAEDFLRVLL